MNNTMESPTKIIERYAETNNIPSAKLFGRLLFLLQQYHTGVTTASLNPTSITTQGQIMGELSAPLQWLGKADQFPNSLLEALGNSVQMAMWLANLNLREARKATTPNQELIENLQDFLQVDSVIDRIIKDIKNQSEKRALEVSLAIMDSDGNIDPTKPPRQQ